MPFVPRLIRIKETRAWMKQFLICRCLILTSLVFHWGLINTVNCTGRVPALRSYSKLRTHRFSLPRLDLSIWLLNASSSRCYCKNYRFVNVFLCEWQNISMQWRISPELLVSGSMRLRPYDLRSLDLSLFDNLIVTTLLLIISVWKLLILINMLQWPINILRCAYCWGIPNVLLRF